MEPKMIGSDEWIEDLADIADKLDEKALEQLAHKIERLQKAYDYAEAILHGPIQDVRPATIVMTPQVAAIPRDRVELMLVRRKLVRDHLLTHGPSRKSHLARVANIPNGTTTSTFKHEWFCTTEQHLLDLTEAGRQSVHSSHNGVTHADPALQTT